MKVDVILGLQWGDEGKGKIVDFLTPQYDIIARFQGGPNAGHTLEFGNIKHILQTIPSGIFHTDKINLIGNGVLIDAHIFMNEIRKIREKGFEPKNNLKLSRKAHFIIPTQRLVDAAQEANKGEQKIGSTLKGIGPAYTDKVARHGLRIADLLSADFNQKYETLKQSHLNIIKSLNFDIDTAQIDKMPWQEYEKLWMADAALIKEFDLVQSEYYINQALNQGKRVLAEGAQGSLLDIDFGTYPFVTSSNTTTAGVCSGLGVAPSRIGKVYGLFKAYCTRVGSGPFPTELFDATGENLRNLGFEYGSTTGRPRRCGWLDLVALNYTVMLNGVTDLIVTKIDVLDTFENLSLCLEYDVNGLKTNQFPDTSDVCMAKPILTPMKGWNSNIQDIKEYEKLPENVKAYIKFVETNLKCPVSIVSTGPNRQQTILR